MERSYDESAEQGMGGKSNKVKGQMDKERGDTDRSDLRKAVKRQKICG